MQEDTIIQNNLFAIGKIIIQKKIRILKKDTPKSLAKRILIEENKLYPKALQKIALKI